MHFHVVHYGTFIYVLMILNNYLYMRMRSVLLILTNVCYNIPSGTRWAYKHHPVFGQFKNIEIDDEEE